MKDIFLRQPLPIATDGLDWNHFVNLPHASTDGVRIYAIGDIHGSLDELVAMNAAIDHDRRLYPAVQTLIIYLGDLIDRGAESSHVIEYVKSHCDTSDNTTKIICLMGNHDSWLYEFLSDSTILPLWARKGGLETLESYGFIPEDILTAMVDNTAAELMRIALRERMPRSHQDFLASLKLYYRQGDYFFAHAGIDPNISLTAQKKNDLIWIRDPFLKSKKNFGAVVVHGHTASIKVESLPNRINVDTGIYATEVLSCVVLDSTHRYFITINGRTLENVYFESKAGSV
ncbi:metallophosphoesterase [Dickeya dianthicola]|uniref:metallophosphoesterase n=1 Tax=Dickeya dianthicola TaxID=204039 RepID=UPI000688126A|nr:metallophosphoesterase [Dickeya dianthicola]MCI4186801.1 metallophosphoesterase [Dickeya dianthicola]MZG44955.1 serine/threonine protein phosphatase [Dickeya dianthicola]